MPLGANIAAVVSQTDARMVCPISVTSEWATVIDAGGLATADASSITNPTTQIVASTSHIFTFGGRAGSLVCARMAYTGTPGTDPIIVAFGRTVRVGGTGIGPWERLPSLKGSTTTTATMTTVVASDVTDGTLFFTQCDSLAHIWDRKGCNEIVFGIQTAYAVSAGVATAAFLVAKAL